MLPVTLLTGLDEAFRGDIAGNLLGPAGPAGVMVEYDVSGLTTGSVVRIARTAAGVIDREVITMAHPCVSCGMGDSLVELLTSIAAVERYDVAVVKVPGAGDSQAIATEIPRTEEHLVDAVDTVLDTTAAETHLTCHELIQVRGIATAAEDNR